MTVISSLVRFGRRQLHTILSREIIKPSSPTPSSLKTYNLSPFDQLAPDAYIPMVIFYPKSNNNSHASILDMKNSLSQTLAQYYPFAGRVAKTTPSFVDCNDEGVESFEAQNDKELSDFLHNMQHDDLDQLFPDGLVWKKLRGYNGTASPLAVQVNQFACGGIAVAVSLSHKIADGSSMCNFFNDWAIMTRLHIMDQKYVLPVNPQFISFENTNLNYQGVSIDKLHDNSVRRSFLFPGTKINKLKLKVIAMTTESEQPILNPTRIEVLNWLLYKCLVKAATENNLGSFKPTGFVLVTNIRNKMTEPLPKTTIGNIVSLPSFSTKNPNEITLDTFVGQLKNLKMKVQGFQNIKNTVEIFSHASVEEGQRELNDYYVSSSLCRYPLYEIDFGRGKPIKAAIAGRMPNNSFNAMDTRDGD